MLYIQCFIKKTYERLNYWLPVVSSYSYSSCGTTEVVKNIKSRNFKPQQAVVLFDIVTSLGSYCMSFMTFFINLVCTVFAKV